MNRNDYLSITPEIQQAIADGKPSSRWNPPS